MTASGEIWRIVASAPHIMASSEGRVMPTPRNEPMKGGYRAYGGIPSWGTWDRQQGRFVVTIGGGIPAASLRWSARRSTARGRKA
jgi:hypothetical protein